MSQIKKNQIIILNGPNLNLTGKRQPEIYGTKNFDDFLQSLKEKYRDIEIIYFQSNYEGKIIDTIQNAQVEKTMGIVLNAGAFTHYSYAIRDAVEASKIPVIEVHISNIFKREEFRQKSVLSAVCDGLIAGFGLHSYELAVHYLMTHKIHSE